MSLSDPTHRTYSFGGFTLDIDRGALRKAGVDIKLRPKSFDVLTYLVERHGTLAEKHALIDTIWGKTAVTDDALTQCLIEIRRALADSDKTMIRTVPRRGYIFDAAVTYLAGDSTDQNPARNSARKTIGIASSMLTAIVLASLYWWFAHPNDQSQSRTETNPKYSLAVLPFLDMSAAHDQQYFSDGLADTILHMLAQVRELRVVSRTSSFQFRDQALDVAIIGKQLNVSAILEGSVQRSGEKIRVTAQLIDVSGDFHLWSGTFDRNLGDVFAIQDEIASKVVAALKVKLLGKDIERLNVDQTDNVDAYTEYLLAINDLNSVSTENLKSAVNHLQEAVRLDPRYAQAYSTLGRAYLSLADWGSMSTTEAFAAAREAASRALDIYADSSEALAVLGLAEFRDGNLESAGQLLNKAIENSPNDVVALRYYARYLRQDARPDEAIAIYRQILRLDPLSERAHLGLAITFGVTQRFSEASETIANFLRIEPESAIAFSTKFTIDMWQGHWAAAIATMTDLLALDPDDPEGPGIIGLAYLALDMPEEASRWFDRAIEIDAEHPMSRAAPLWLNYYLQQNEDESFRLARELLEDRIGSRHGSDTIAFTILIEHAVRTGRYEAALELLDNLYPHLFDDPPHDLDKDIDATYFTALALINSGDVDRGSHLMRSVQDSTERLVVEGYGVHRRSVAGRLVLGDTDAALDRLAGLAEIKHFWIDNRLLLERSPVYDPIREEPAFIALLDEYHKNAAKQRQILQAMNENTSSP